MSAYMLGSISALDKLGVVVHVSNPTWETEAGGAEAPSHPQLHRESAESLGCFENPVSKQTNEQANKQMGKQETTQTQNPHKKPKHNKPRTRSMTKNTKTK